MTNLKTLNLNLTKTTDAGLVHIKGLTTLERLDLNACTQITDAGLVHLEKMTNLKILSLVRTRVSRGAYRKLRKSLPKCWVNFP